MGNKRIAKRRTSIFAFSIEKNQFEEFTKMKLFNQIAIMTLAVTAIKPSAIKRQIMKKIRGYQHELPANQDRHNRKILQEQKKEEKKRKKEISMIRTRSGFMPGNEVQMDAVVVEVEEEEEE